MSRWFLINSDMVFTLAACRLTDKEFRKAFYDAVEGRDSPLAPFIKGPYSRPLAHEWREIRSRIFLRDDFTCSYCGERGGKLECDHIVPVAKGGGHEDHNLTTACRPCNRAKRDKLVEEWVR